MNASNFFLFFTLPIIILSLSNNSSINKIIPNVKRQNIKCTGNNSFVNDDGKCECKNNFPFGDPNTELGCWNCDPACDSNAICYQQDKCKCLPGFYRFGTNNKLCRRPIPELLTAEPQTGPTSGGTKVILQIKSPTNHSITRAFCRFGPFSVPAKFTNNTIFICVSPFCKKGKMPLAVSFDSSNWSEQKIFFDYYSDQFSAYNCILFSILILIISMILIIIIWFLKSNKDFLFQSEETLPLNQWHMNQEQGNATEEKGFLDFMKNIVFS